MATQLEFAREYLNIYAELAQIKLNMAKAQQVVDALPVSLAKQIECLEVKRHKVGDHYVNDIVITDTKATQYTLLQNVTQPLSHQVAGEYQTGTFNAYMGKNRIVNNLFFSIESRENAELIAQ